MGMSFFVLGKNYAFAQAESIATTAEPEMIEIAPANGTSTVAILNGAVNFIFLPHTFSATTSLQAVNIPEEIVKPWNLARVSKIYQFDFSDKNVYSTTTPFTVQLRYQASDNLIKQICFFDGTKNAWRPLPTRYDWKKQTASAHFSLPFAQLAVFSNLEIRAVGKASWYKFKQGNFAASAEFPKNSRLRVTNAANGKFIDVVINDYGPDKTKHPERAIDLDSAAFKRIASTRDGVIEVRIEPLIVPEINKRLLGIATAGVKDFPEINSVAALVMNEATNEMIFNKNADAVVPLASLTKIITASVFLDTKPNWKKVVAYGKADAEKNWQYADKNDIAKLNLKDGDKLTVRDLFFTTLMASTNNTAETLARLSGLAREQFIQKMNDKVKEWGALNTNFIEPTGLSPLNVSSARDYAIISKEALKNKDIAEATSLTRYKFTTRRDKIKKTVVNTNKLLATNHEIIGGKTGYLDEARYCLMTKIKFEKNNLIGVVLGAAEREQSFIEMEDLLKYGKIKLNSL